MIKSSEDSRVQTVLNAFDTLFNKRDYAAAERFWPERYIQHSAHVPPGRDGRRQFRSSVSRSTFSADYTERTKRSDL